MQNTGTAEGKKPGRGQVAQGQGELRVLRAGQNAAAAGGHHVAAGQGVHHTADHIVPEAERLLGTRRPAVDEGRAAVRVQNP